MASDICYVCGERNRRGSVCRACCPDGDPRLKPAHTPVAPVSPDATGAAQTFDQIVSYVLRYGGKCRDCADVDGICPNTDMPCGFELKTAVIKHTLKALEYGMSHGFIENPFSLPAPDATGKCGELETVDDLWDELVNYDDRTSPAEYPDMALITKGELADFVDRSRSQAVELLAAERAKYRDAMEKLVDSQRETLVWQQQAIDLKADNAALTARVNVQGQEISDQSDMIADQLKMIEALEAKLAAAEHLFQTTIAAWESLPGGRSYSKDVIQEWIIGPMQKAINRIRTHLEVKP